MNVFLIHERTSYRNINKKLKISRIFIRDTINPENEISAFENISDITREFLDEINLNSDFLPIPDAAVSYLPCD